MRVDNTAHKCSAFPQFRSVLVKPSFGKICENGSLEVAEY